MEVTVKGNNKHHKIPRSRGGKDENNIVSLPANFHQAWHVLFDNLTVQEAHRLIDMVMVAGHEHSGQDIENLRQQLKHSAEVSAVIHTHIVQDHEMETVTT